MHPPPKRGGGQWGPHCRGGLFVLQTRVGRGSCCVWGCSVRPSDLQGCFIPRSAIEPHRQHQWWGPEIPVTPTGAGSPPPRARAWAGCEPWRAVGCCSPGQPGGPQPSPRCRSPCGARQGHGTMWRSLPAAWGRWGCAAPPRPSSRAAPRTQWQVWQGPGHGAEKSPGHFQLPRAAERRPAAAFPQRFSAVATTNSIFRCTI